MTEKDYAKKILESFLKELEDLEQEKKNIYNDFSSGIEINIEALNKIEYKISVMEGCIVLKLKKSLDVIFEN